MTMRTAACRLLEFLCCLCVAHATCAQTIVNPIGGSSNRAAGVMSDQYLAARFDLTTPTTLNMVASQFLNTSGSFFAALVPLSSTTALPEGTPSTGVPFNPGEVLAYRTFDVDVGSTATIISTPFFMTLPAGVYGVVFGTGLYGSSGIGSMPEYGRVDGSSSFFWSSAPWRWQDSMLMPTGEFNIMISVPEPQSAVLLMFGICALMGRLRHSRRLHAEQ